MAILDNEHRRSLHPRSILNDASGMSIPTVIFAIAMLCVGINLHLEIADIDEPIVVRSRNVVTVSENWRQQELDNRRVIRNLTRDQSLDAATQSMPDADFYDQYGDNVGVLFYRTRTSRTDGVTSKKSETTPLMFVDDKLVSWGDYQADRRDWVSETSNDWQERQTGNRRYIQNLEAGESIQTVKDALGKPSFTEQIGDSAEILFYRTHSATLDLRTSKLEETTPLVFVDEKLVASDYGAGTMVE